MIIQDPQKLLPPDIQNTFGYEGNEQRIIEIPAHGVSLHKKSLEKLLLISKRKDTIIVFKPTFPILSELGLPSYPILAYSYPTTLSHIWEQLRQNINSSLKGNIANSLSFDVMSQVHIIEQIDIDEQLHYFAKYYGKAINPSYIRVVLSNTCNLKCVMCPYHSTLLKPSHTSDFFEQKKEMSWEMMEKLAIDCGKAQTTVLIGSIEEPLLHPKLIDFIKLCRKQGVPKVHLTTNGQLLDENCTQTLLKAGLTSIDISIDAATPKTYRKIRGASFNRVESNVMNFLKIRDRLGISCQVRTSFVMNKDVSTEEKDNFLNRWLPKVNNVFVLNLAEYQNSNIRLKETNQEINQIIQQYQQKAEGRWPCLFPFIEMAVLPNGRIYYCIETLFRLGFDQEIESLGDYKQQTLPEIWSGELFQKLRRDLILNQLKKRSSCKNCDMWKSQVIKQERKAKYQVLTTMVTEIYTQTE